MQGKVVNCYILHNYNVCLKQKLGSTFPAGIYHRTSLKRFSQTQESEIICWNIFWGLFYCPDKWFSVIISIWSNHNIRIITRAVITADNSLIVPEEPHAPQIKRDHDVIQDVGGAYAGPFNEGEELKLLCEVHGGTFDYTINIWRHMWHRNFLNVKEFVIWYYFLFSSRSSPAPGVLACRRQHSSWQHLHWAWQGCGGKQTTIHSVSINDTQRVLTLQFCFTIPLLNLINIQRCNVIIILSLVFPLHCIFYESGSTIGTDQKLNIKSYQMLCVYEK